ncbi:MAG: T9SS type A sorting domain-containing protein [Candidatus Cloacimonetes bacterium]|nr:T9SS type A sorting domain-containing protein [Candidatus Cloacimonadota bacterium]
MKYLLLILLTFSLLYAYDWTPIYSGDHEIYDFSLCQTGLNQYALACEDGLLIYDGDVWTQHSSSLPVWNVLPWINQQLILVQGNGSYSDGVYKFNEYTCEFEVIEWIYYPNFLVYNENQQEYYIGAFEGLFKSADGEIWEEVAYFSGRSCHEMAFWENHYAVSIIDYVLGVYYSDDYGSTWNAPVMSFPAIIDMSFRNDSKLFGVDPGPTAYSGLLSSTDFGASWEIEYGIECLSSVCHDMSGNTFVAGSVPAFDGVAMWLNGEMIPMNDGLPNLNINNLYVNPAMSSIHIMAFTDSGAYLLTNYTSSEPVLPTPGITLYNFPNPFNPSTEISFQTSDFSGQTLEIEIYNSKGQKIDELSIPNSQPDSAGLKSSITWEADKFSSGVYLYKLVIDGKEVANNKMLLLK